MPIALPWRREWFLNRKDTFVTHITRQTSLRASGGRPGVIRSITRQESDWADCLIDLTATSGFGNHGRRLLRDYSILDLELRIAGRGSYTYFFAGEPNLWGLIKNFETLSEARLLDQGFALIRITPADLLAAYDGPLFFRPDDNALIIRGSYAGPARVRPLTI
jgi:hypothetical protein